MELNLYRTSRFTWAVKVSNELIPYKSIEAAAEAMVSAGVKEDAIDAALIEMEFKGHTRANFGMNGNFIYTDGDRAHEAQGNS
jgi:hypothetical protein